MYKNQLTIMTLALLTLPAGFAQGGEQGNSKQEIFEKSTTCGKDTPGGKPIPFDPSCYVRIYEDAGDNKRTMLYSYEDPRVFSRILKADAGSKIVIDLAHGLDINNDLGLNQFSVRAQLKTKNATKPVEVVGYSEVGVSEEEKEAQRAFGLQTFRDLSTRMFTLYSTLKDFLISMETDPKPYKREDGSGGCAEVLLNIEGHDSISSLLPTENCKSLKLGANAEAVARFDSAFQRYKERLKGLAKFFSSPETRTVAAEVAAQVFRVDAETMAVVAGGIATRIETLEKDKPGGVELTEAARHEQKQLLLLDLASVLFRLRFAHGEIVRIAEDQPKPNSADKEPQFREKYGTINGCPESFFTLPVFAPSRLSGQSYFDFPQRCVTEVLRRSFVNSLRKYLVYGTISLPTYDVASGDVLTLTIEARGSDKKTLGATARFYIYATSYGWKLSATDSLLFIKRIGVPERLETSTDPNEPNAGLRSIRFRPFPGFTLGTTYHYRGTKTFCDIANVKSRLEKVADAAMQTDYAERTRKLKDVDAPQTIQNCSGGEKLSYRVPAFSAKERFLRVLAPGIGINTTIMYWDGGRFNPTNSKFGDDVNATNFQLGVGPIVSLFDNRISFTYGWNLMAPRQRTYYGVGFSFVRFGQDVAKLFK